jgi:hypothetical protein
MAAAIEAGRAQRRTDAWTRKLEKAREQRQAAARKRWGAEERERLAVEWREYWRLWSSGLPLSVARQLPKPKAPLPFWRERMRKALKTVMRKEGIRVAGRHGSEIRDQRSGIRGQRSEIRDQGIGSRE